MLVFSLNYSPEATGFALAQAEGKNPEGRRGEEGYQQVTRYGSPQPVWRPNEFIKEAETQAAILRDLFGNPVPVVSLPPSVRAWNDGLILKLATAIYEEPSLPEGHLDSLRLGVLADALEEAGVTDPDILGHLRQQGAVHVRGCWCLDLLLAKE